MADVRYLGLFANECVVFPEVTELRWRRVVVNESITDLGIAPQNAYIKLTKSQIAALFWRVKEWSISWKFSAKSIGNSVITTYPDDGITITQAYSFSYPETENFGSFRAQHLTIGVVNEKQLVCRGFESPFNGVGRANQFISIQSTETQSFENSNPNEPVDPPETYDYSREVVSANNVSLGNFSSFNDLEVFLDFDQGKIGDFYYLPLTIDYIAEIANATTDNILFDEEVEVASSGDPSYDITGTLPPIGGILTSVPRGSTEEATISEYKAYFHMPAPSSEIVEIDLYDATEPSALSNTKFNLDGFSGITIKPHEYWPYDPNDGGGPIYDSVTGAQLRPFP